MCNYCGKELHGEIITSNIGTGVCTNPECPAYSLLQAGEFLMRSKLENEQAD